jgi:hypothetical protein
MKIIINSGNGEKWFTTKETFGHNKRKEISENSN